MTTDPSLALIAREGCCRAAADSEGFAHDHADRLAEVESLRTQLAEVTRERDEAAHQAARAKGRVEHLTKDLACAAKRCVGCYHCRGEYYVDGRDLADAEAALAAALKVVETAKAFAIAARSPEHQRFYRSPWAEMADILAAVDAYQQPTPPRVESFEVGDQQFTFEVEESGDE